jgi:hypothetical protein
MRFLHKPLLGIKVFATFGKRGAYSKKVNLNDRYRDSCVNEGLVKKGSFTIRKSLENSGFWEFQALLTKGICCFKAQVLSTLRGDEGGTCNSVETSPGSYQCGLATTLMEFCFTDPDIGTVDPKVNRNFQRENAVDHRNLAIENCDHIVYLSCDPTPPIPNAACSAYLTAAINTGHTMMFTKYFRKGGWKWDVLKTATSKIMVKSNADNFIKDYGSEWFFCKCKTKRLKECEAM